MSCSVRIAHPSAFLKALTVMAPANHRTTDPWISLLFLGGTGGLAIHHASEDLSVTTTASMPRELFSDFTTEGDCRFMVSLASLVTAIGVCTQSAAGAGARVLLEYPNSDGKCNVEIGDGDVAAQCSLLTRSVKDRLLDLRFEDALAPNRVTLRGDVVKDLVADLLAFSTEHVNVFFSAASMCLHGTGSPHGSLTIEVDRGGEGVILFEAADDSVQSKYLCTHALHALGGNAATKEWFEQVQLRVNTERQLCVQHYGRAAEMNVTLEFVVQPLSMLLDM
jgi:hypothetical protein